MTRLLLSFLLSLILLLLVPVVLWFGVRWLVKRTSLKTYGGWIASFVILFLPLLFVYNLLKGRDGNEVYEAVFKAPKPDCVKIIRYKDAHLPIIDDDIILHFHTCPQEVERILKMNKDTPGLLSTDDILIQGDLSFKIRSMGDSVLRIHPPLRENGAGMVMYIKSDSTEIYYRDWDR